MNKKNNKFLYISISVAFIIGTILCIFFETEIFKFVLAKHYYFISIFLFALSFFIVFKIISKSKKQLLYPSLFLLFFFVSAPLLGMLNFKDFLRRHSDFFGRQIPPFDFPIFIWSVGMVCFFLGVLISHIIIPSVNNRFIVIWKKRHLLLFLKLTLIFSVLATFIAIYKIGYIPLLKENISPERTGYVEIVGPLVYRFTGLWLVVGLLSSGLFFYERKKRKYIYLFLLAISAIGKMLYAQRTGLVLLLFIFGLMYIKFYKIKISHVSLIGIFILFLIYILMVQGDYRSGRYSANISFKDRIIRDTFHEWGYYSIIVDETKITSDYLGWKIFLGPFVTLIPRQVYTFFGYDKDELIENYSAVYYYGRQFNEPYGIRITPIGEAFAGYGIGGVIFQLFILGALFGAIEKSYIKLRIQDARLYVICFLFSLMLYMPICTLFMLLAPLEGPGLFVFAYYIFGTRKYEIRNKTLKY